MMQVSLVNDGPVTITLSSRDGPPVAEDAAKTEKARKAEELRIRTEDNRRKKEEASALWSAKHAEGCR